MIELPTKKIPAESMNPRTLVLFSHTKVGKSTVCAALPNSLLIDLEDGSHYLDAMKINVKQEALKNKVSVLRYLRNLSETLATSEHKYDFIIIDTATALEEIAEELATILYKQTTIGKNFEGSNVVTQLDKGAGYNWLREAFAKLYSYFSPYAVKGFIILGHVKLASLTKEGQDLSTRDLQLTGKLKGMVCQGADAIGYLYRNPDNTNEVVVSFKTNPNDLATGARSEHLRGQEIVLSEYNPATKEFTYHWDKIYPGWV
jgi:hypothetical protein